MPKTLLPNPNAGIPVACPKCGRAMGRMVQVNGQVRLAAGGWLITEGSQTCAGCGRPFVFKPPRVPFDEVMRRAQKRALDGAQHEPGK